MQYHNKIIIRDYKKDDFKQVIQLWDKTRLGGKERGDDENIIATTLKHDGKFLVMIDSEKNKIVGTSWITNDGRRLYLHHFTVDPEYQNQNLGYKLGVESLKFATNSKMQIKLEVESTNIAAQHLYHKLGFKPLGNYTVQIIRNTIDLF